MKEHGILFSGPMVCAILDGRKMQTRRVVNPQPEYEGKECYGDSWKWTKGEDNFSGVTTEQLVGPAGLCHHTRAVYGVPGDRLWVRETWCQSQHLGDIFYRATHGFKVMIPWRPSIFMPKKFSRITLEIVNVRVERVQDISEKDARAEGCDMRPGLTAIGSFSQLWDSINAKRGFSWDKNPWVWVIAFNQVPSTE